MVINSGVRGTCVQKKLFYFQSEELAAYVAGKNAIYYAERSAI